MSSHYDIYGKIFILENNRDQKEVKEQNEKEKKESQRH